MVRGQKPLILKTWRIGQSSAQRSTMPHQKSVGTNNLLVLGGQEKLLQEWVSSENAPKLQATTPRHSIDERLFGSI